ncbi:flagellar filament capping protein FliD [Paenibacillus tarimensis]
MRISGFASGMDIDSMVQELMKARRTSLNTIVQKRTLVEWQREAYRELSTKIVDFRNNKLPSYSLSNSMNAKTSSVSGNTNTLTVNSTSASAAGTLNVQVDQIASAANTILKYDGGSTAGKTLAELGFTVDGNDEGTVSVNGISISYLGTESLGDLAAKINANKDVKATALYNETTGELSITNTLTGAGNVDLLDFPASGFTVTATAGQNSIAKINGITYEQASNRFSVNGFDFTVKAESGAGGATTITAVTDTNKIIETIKSFINDYNSLIGSINSELQEEKYRSYMPLTEEQKEEMGDKQIELWEEKARSGLLRNDTIFNKLVSDLRITSTAEVGGINIDSIGISTGKWYEKGKLILVDEAKLRDAIEANPDEVASLFTLNGTDKSPLSTESGIFVKMRESLMTTLQSLSKKAGTSLSSTDLNGSFMENSLLGDQIRQMKSRESLLNSRLISIENQYYKQFTAMETAINKFNAQASSLFSFTS